jgi:hypothetical protein
MGEIKGDSYSIELHLNGILILLESFNECYRICPFDLWRILALFNYLIDKYYIMEV